MRIRSSGGALRITVPCKVNLFLEVLGPRDDGYHEIVTVMHPIDVCDTLVCRPSKDICLTGDLAALGDDNLVVRAVRAAQRFAATRRSLRMCLRKRIPTGAGLGGGSADAAAAITAMNLAHRLRLTASDLQAIAAAVGSDVAFFLDGRTALCTGRGERVAPVRVEKKMHFVLVYPGFESSTGRVYRRLAPGLTHHPKDVKPLLGPLAEGRLPEIGRAMFNRLETPAFELNPPLRSLKRAMKKLGFVGVVMSGSGSSIIGLSTSAVRARAQARRLAGQGQIWVARSIETAASATRSY